MKFTTTFASIIVALASTSSILAAPVDIAERDVWDPRILYPHAGTVWKLGETHSVVWATDDAPEHISNGAAIYLRTDAGPVEPALAKDFDLRSGRQTITVPKHIAPATDYRIVLFGDSGNWNPEFTITA